ncbi:hypothetical protein KSS87_020038 [Heliosperma pusillum]|nr:hypothetical protein KSS87_020038 [Heliosperma pusillum]
MTRQLKFHEKRLLKKLNLLEWKREGGHREAGVMQRYLVTDGDDYKKYNVMCRMVQKLVNILKQMDPRDPFRIQMTDQLLEKLYNMGAIPNRKSLAQKFAQHKKAAVQYIEQGHIRVGVETVTDPAFLVTRNMEDLLTWETSSRINVKIRQYNDNLDDYDLMQ